MFKLNNKNDVFDVVLMFLLLTLKYFTSSFSISFVDFEQVNVSWDSFFQFQFKQNCID